VVGSLASSECLAHAQTLLTHPRITRRAYGLLTGDDPVLSIPEVRAAAVALETAFQWVVEADMQRSGIPSDGLHLSRRLGVYTGLYARMVRWHHDDFRDPSVAWMASFGGSTWGAEGPLSRQDVNGDGYLTHPNEIIGPGKRLKLIKPGDGTVCQVMRTGAAHCGPEAGGPRLYMVATAQLR